MDNDMAMIYAYSNELFLFYMAGDDMLFILCPMRCNFPSNFSPTPLGDVVWRHTEPDFHRPYTRWNEERQAELSNIARPVPFRRYLGINPASYEVLRAVLGSLRLENEACQGDRCRMHVHLRARYVPRSPAERRAGCRARLRG